MTSQSPRIYIYKITFEEVPYYYYGVHKEKKYNEYYMGSPTTHKWCWNFYTPKKQILQFFEFTSEGWLEANKIEDRLIKPVFNTDKWCLNECCGGSTSLEIRRRVGKNLAKNKLGFHKLTREQKSEAGKKGGSKTKQLGIGIFSLTKEDQQKHGSKMGKITYEMGIGIHSLSKEELSEAGKKGYANGLGKISKEEKSEVAKRNYKNGTGIASIPKDQKVEYSRKGGRTSAKIINAQRWECLETGYISTAAGVVSYQKCRGIDTSKNNRKRIE